MVLPEPPRVEVTSENSHDAAILNPLSGPAWDKAITSHSEATVFHTSAWARVLADSYGHCPLYLKLSHNGQLVALVPLMEVRSRFAGSRGICLPFSDHCGPLLFGHLGAGIVREYLKTLGRERGWSYLEVRDEVILPERTPPSESYWSHQLDLTQGSAALSRSFSSSVRRALRKAERSGLEAHIRSDSEAMAQFFSLHLRTRHKHGVPPQPRAFFANIQKHILETGLGIVVTAEKSGKVVAAAVFFKLGLNAIYKFGASDERVQEFRPNNLVMAAAIDFLAASSVETLHFGRTEKSNEGLRRFKASWGATESEISYGKFAISTDNWVQARTPISSFSNRIFRALPGPLNRLAGSLLYPHLD